MIFGTVPTLASQLVVPGLLVLILILLAWIVYLEIRLGRLFRGKKATNFEGIIADIGQAIDELFSQTNQGTKRLDNIEQRLRRTLSKFHTVRFNPFKDHGGNQSFATCLMDDSGDGVVVSSIYTRDKVSVYAKPLTHQQSTYELTEEERQSIAEAAKR
ncbi:MAG: DUF4446 family protein [Candidatus Vogelbacteria bacterium]|nr:DUF4446 family protein [Candidatus Vogelbacteria bacterium]